MPGVSLFSTMRSKQAVFCVTLNIVSVSTDFLAMVAKEVALMKTNVSRQRTSAAMMPIARTIRVYSKVSLQNFKLEI